MHHHHIPRVFIYTPDAVRGLFGFDNSEPGRVSVQEGFTKGYDEWMGGVWISILSRRPLQVVAGPLAGEAWKDRCMKSHDTLLHVDHVP